MLRWQVLGGTNVRLLEDAYLVLVGGVRIIDSGGVAASLSIEGLHRASVSHLSEAARRETPRSV